MCQSGETRIALIGIIVEDGAAADRINALLHQCAAWIVGRMGVPYRQKGGSLAGVSVKTIYAPSAN